MKVVINTRYGGFAISHAAAEFMAKRGNARAIQELKKSDKEDHFYGFGYAEGFEGGYERNDPDLIAAIETLGAEANGFCSRLKIVEIPDGVEWEIDDYDGLESIHEVHRVWS